MSEPSGVGYGGDRPGIWVEPKRDEAVSLEACTIKACDKDWVVTPTKKNNKILYTVSNADQQKICCITTDDSLTSQQLESILTKELGKAMDLKAYQRISHDDHADEIITVNEPNEEALLFCPISGEMRWTPYIPEHRQHQPLATPEAYPVEGSKKASDDGGDGWEDEEVNEKAWEMFHEHWNALGTKEQDAVYRELGLERREYVDFSKPTRMKADKVTGDPSTFHCDDCLRDYPLSDIGRTLKNKEVICKNCWKSRQQEQAELENPTRMGKKANVPDQEYKGYGIHKFPVQEGVSILNEDGKVIDVARDPADAILKIDKILSLHKQTSNKKVSNVNEEIVEEYVDSLLGAGVPDVRALARFYLDNPRDLPQPMEYGLFEQNFDAIIKALPIRASLNKKAELIREIHKATDQYNYNGTEYNLSNGTLKKDQVIPLSKTHVRLTDPTKSRYERYAGNGEWQLISDVDFAKYKAEWDEINKANYGPKATAEKVAVRQALLEDLKKNCPDCYAKFEKFAKEKGVRIILDKKGTQSFRTGDTVALRKDWMSLLQEQFGQGASYWEDEVSSLIHRQPGAENDPEFSTVPLKVERVGDISVDSDSSFPVYVDVVIVDGVEIPESIVEKQVTKQADLDQLLKQVETIRTRINTVKERIQSSGSKKKADNFPGGLADKKKPEDFDPIQLEKGIKVEMEHTDDPEKAKEIAMDHLVEDAVYYDKLQQMENKDTHPIEENAVVELVKWIELDLDMIENAYRDRPEVIQHIENIENQITELEQKLGLEHAKPIHEMEEKEHKKASLTRYICPDCNKPTVEEGYLGWRECTRPRCGWKEGPQPSTLTEVEVKESFLRAQLQKKFAAHIQRGDAYVLRFLEDFDYEYEKDIQAILSNGASVDERFAAIKKLIPELFDRLIDDKQINIKQVEWSPVQVDDQDIMKLIEDHDGNKEDSVEKESAAYKVPKPTTPPPQGFQWAYDPKLASWNLVATE